MSNPHAGRRVSESEWTKHLLQTGHAELAPSEIEHRARGEQAGRPQIGGTKDDRPAGTVEARQELGGKAVESSDTPPPRKRRVNTTPERRRELKDMAEQITRK